MTLKFTIRLPYPKVFVIGRNKTGTTSLMKCKFPQIEFYHYTQIGDEMMKFKFWTFADKRFNASLKRIQRQAKRMHIFDQILAFDEGELAPEFRTKFSIC